ncbi:hypothetical protein M0R45_000422 [Rubus argutus]|uniref:Uncharacterized protein n=1 Tax=Rubus argutus TaxID=59490 RepID=A0AAW1VLZ7_RUBAR
MAPCGLAQETVRRWASASNLARLSISAEPWLQASLLMIPAFLLKYAKDMGGDEGDDDEEDKSMKERRQRKMQTEMLSQQRHRCACFEHRQKAELERVLEDTIEMLEEEEDQERVLSLWLHHFTYCSSSDWPNLHASYARWCDALRKLLLIHHS